MTTLASSTLDAEARTVRRSGTPDFARTRYLHRCANPPSLHRKPRVPFLLLYPGACSPSRNPVSILLSVPLAAGASKTFWVSTEANQTYAFSTGHWYQQVPRMYYRLTSALDPEVQQEPGTTSPHGWISAQAWEREDGLPSYDDRYLRTLTPGAVSDLPAHKVEVLRVVVGKDTHVIDGRVHTSGGQPVASVLVKVTRKAKPSEGRVENRGPLSPAK